MWKIYAPQKQHDLSSIVLTLSFTGKLGLHLMPGWRRSLAGRIVEGNHGGKRGVIATGRGDRYFLFWWGRFLILNFSYFLQSLSTLRQNVSIWINQGSILIVHTCVVLKNHTWRWKSSQDYFWSDHDLSQEDSGSLDLFPPNAQNSNVSWQVLWNCGVSIFIFHEELHSGPGMLSFPHICFFKVISKHYCIVYNV